MLFKVLPLTLALLLSQSSFARSKHHDNDHKGHKPHKSKEHSKHDKDHDDDKGHGWHNKHKPKIFKHWFGHDGLTVFSPEWFDKAHQQGVFVFGNTEETGNFRVLVNGQSAQVDANGNFVGMAEVPRFALAMPVKVEVQKKKHGKWKTVAHDTIVMTVDHRNRFSEPVAQLSCAQVAPNQNYIVNCNASASIDYDGALRDFLWIVDNGSKILRGENVTFDAGSVGAHSIKLVAIDDDGLQGTAQTNLNIAPLNSAPSIAINLTSDEGVVPASVTGSISANDPDNNLESVSWVASNGQYGEGLSFNLVADVTGPLTVTAVATDSLGLQAETTATFNAVAPIIAEPSELAPETKPNESTTMDEQVAFLYEGTNAIQKGVAPGAIDKKRIAVVTGKVLNNDGDPIAGVKVSFNQKDEFGYTFTRADGEFDMALNAGTHTLKFEQNSFISAQRNFSVKVGGFNRLEDLVLVQLDSNVTPVQMGSSEAQVAAGSPIVDQRGERTNIVVVPSGTTATAVLPDGTERVLDTASIRVTEFTVGENGPKRMPANLPAASAYTHATNYHIDEAANMGAKTVKFNQRLLHYVDNFLGFPAGSGIPLAMYDEELSAWMPSKDGFVLDVVAVNGGVAEVDANGDGSADDQATLDFYGITNEELATLGSRYQAGSSLVRYEIHHFSTSDGNAGQGTNGSGSEATSDNQGNHNSSGSGNSACGSIINLQDCSVGEMINLVGSNLDLFYNSKADANNKNEREFNLRLSGDEIDAVRIRLSYNVMGKEFVHDYPAQPNLFHKITWDGKNKYGKDVYGSIPVDVKISYFYTSYYRYFPFTGIASFASSTISDLQPGETVPAPDLEIPKNFRIYLTNQFHKPVGNMFLSDHHFYDPGMNRLFYGDGTQRDVAEKSLVTVRPFDKYFGAAAKHPVTGEVYFTKYIDEQGNYNRTCIHKVTASGDVVRVAGRAPCHETSNEVPSERYPDKDQVKFVYINKLQFDEQGNLFFNDIGGNIIYKLSESSGVLERIAGTGMYPATVDNETFFNYTDQIGYEADVPIYSFTLGQQGWVYISTYSGIYMLHPGDEYRLRAYWFSTAFMPKYLESINMDQKTGGIFYGNGLDSLIEGAPGVAWMHLGLIQPDGGIPTYLTRIGVNPYCGFLQPCEIEPPKRKASEIQTDGYAFLQLEDGSYLTTASNFTGFSFANGSPGAVVHITPAGDANLLVGGGEIPNDANFISPLDGPDLHIRWSMESFVDLGGGDILVTTWNTNKSFVFNMPRPENQAGQQAEYRVADSNRDEIYIFDGKGKHLKTLDLLTEAVKWEFSYNASGEIIGAKDRSGLITSIERDNEGNPSAIIAPFGQRTELVLDGEKVIAVTNPAGNTWQIGYGTNGLMNSFTNPRGLASTFEYNDEFELISDTNAKGGTAYLNKSEDTLDRLAYDFTTTEGVVESLESVYQDEGIVSYDKQAIRQNPDVTTSYRDLSVKEMPRRKISTSASLDPFSNFKDSYASLTQTEVTDGSNTLLGNKQLESHQLEVDQGDIIAKTKFFTFEGLLSGISYNWSERYDLQTRVRTTTSPEERISQVEFDENGREIANSSLGTTTIETSYNSIGKVESLTQGDRLTSFEYDLRGRVIRSIDAIGQEWLYDWDDADRLIFEQDPAGDQTLYSYDQAGNRTSITLPGGRLHQFTFDVLDMEEVYTPPTIGQNTSLQTIYDKDRRLQQAIYPNGESINYGRVADIAGVATPVDELKSVQHTLADGRVRSTTFGHDHIDTGLPTNVIVNEQGSDSIALEYGYLGDLKSQEVMSFNGATQGQLAWNFDDFLRPTSLQVDAGSESAMVAMSYDGDNLLTGLGDQAISREAASGRVSNITLDQVSQSLSYTQYGELASINAVAAGGQVFSEQILERDGLGRIVRKLETDSFGTSEYVYSYDLKGQLIEVEKDGAVVASYNFDIRGNRLSSLALQTPASYDDQDRLLSDGVYNYSYDANGALASRVEIASGDELKLSYDGLSNLKKAELPDGRVIEYLIDGRNRRVGKKVDGVLTTAWIYQDQLNPVAQVDFDGTGLASTTFFFYGTRAHVPDYAIKDGIRYTIVSDHLGSVRQVINAQTGAIVQAQSYSAFGEETNQTGNNLVPFGFAGGLVDQDTGLIRFGARDYDPHSGRWTSKDPIKFDGDGLNIYRYANNDPMNFIDPRGEFGILGIVTSIFLGFTFGGGVDAPEFFPPQGGQATPPHQNIGPDDPNKMQKHRDNNKFENSLCST